MRNTFKNCYSLTSINLSNLINNNYVFIISVIENCGKLISLDLSNFVTSRVNNISSLFSNYSSLENLKLNFDTSQVSKMQYMFNSCFWLKSLDLTSFNTQKCTDFTGIFENDEGLNLYIKNNTCSNLVGQLPDYINAIDSSQR